MAYTGLVVPLPVGQLGFYGGRNPSQMQPGHLAYVDGLDLDGGLIKKEGGAAKLNAAALASGGDIIAGYSWIPTPGTYHDVVITSAGTALRDAGLTTFPTSLATGLTADRDPPPMFVPGGGEAVGAARHLFMFSKSNQVQEITGTGATMQAIATPAADIGGGSRSAVR